MVLWDKLLTRELIHLDKQTKKLIAPIIITILLICYFIFYIGVGLLIAGIPLIAKILVFIIPIGLIILSVYMLFERIEEIKGGEEDDLSKY